MKSGSVLCSVVVVVVVLATACLLAQVTEATYNQSVECVLRPEDFSPSRLGAVISYACGPGLVDCSPIQPGGAHYLPNTIRDHTNWAINQYYQQNQASQSISTCDFDNVAMLQCAHNNGTGLLQERIYGANIGGFLVLEPWIVPSLFEQFVHKSDNATAIDEYTFAKVLGKEEATRQLTAHWNSWVTSKDFEKLAAIGITHVRVPFGYWIFGDVEPFVRGIEQLDRVLDLAKEYNIKVLLDLHGAVGSQNGFDNSGRACDISRGAEPKPCIIPCPKHALWGRDANGSTVNQTLVTIERVVRRYSNHSAVWGFELVNEPRLINMSVLKDFYHRGYHVVRQFAPAHWKVVIHDGFYPLAWGGFMTPRQGFSNVILDTHIYQAFVPYGGDETFDEHLQESCGYTGNIDFMECLELPLIVGEWSLGTTDCTKWLDGFGQVPLSKYCAERPPSIPGNSTFLKRYAEYQASSYYRGHGWFFWNFKTADSPEWDLFHAHDQGWMPSFPLNNSVIEACNYSKVSNATTSDDQALLDGLKVEKN